MSREYVTKEVQAIYSELKEKAPLNIAMASAWIMGNFKGINLKVLDLRNSSGISDFLFWVQLVTLLKRQRWQKKLLIN